MVLWRNPVGTAAFDAVEMQFARVKLSIGLSFSSTAADVPITVLISSTCQRLLRPISGNFRRSFDLASPNQLINKKPRNIAGLLV